MFRQNSLKENEYAILDRTSLNPSDKLDPLAKTIACQDKHSIYSLSREFNIYRKAVRSARVAINTALDGLVSASDEPDCISSLSDKPLKHFSVLIKKHTGAAPAKLGNAIGSETLNTP